MIREEKARKLVESLKPMQLRGEKHPCPRCGRDTMRVDKPILNALSRYADVYICDSCGTEEALEDYYGTPMPLSNWSMARNFLENK